VPFASNIAFSVALRVRVRSGNALIWSRPGLLHTVAIPIPGELPAAKSDAALLQSTNIQMIISSGEENLPTRKLLDKLAQNQSRSGLRRAVPAPRRGPAEFQ
jgi:hypothetical protein